MKANKIAIFLTFQRPTRHLMHLKWRAKNSFLICHFWELVWGTFMLLHIKKNMSSKVNNIYIIFSQKRPSSLERAACWCDLFIFLWCFGYLKLSFSSVTRLDIIWFGGFSTGGTIAIKRKAHIHIRLTKLQVLVYVFFKNVIYDTRVLVVFNALEAYVWEWGPFCRFLGIFQMSY